MTGKNSGKSSDSRRRGTYMISAVADMYSIHPQTLRLYEREGLLKPSRSEGNTRLYSDEDLHRLEVILSLTRDLGVNLAGVEVILNMRQKMERLQQEAAELIEYVRRELLEEHEELQQRFQQALVRVESGSLAVVDKGERRDDDATEPPDAPDEE